MRHKIKVLARDINNGIREDAISCPVALAVRRARIIPLSHLSVGSDYIDAGMRWRCPPNVSKFIDSFDAGNKVKPFSFYVEEEE